MVYSTAACAQHTQAARRPRGTLVQMIGKYLSHMSSRRGSVDSCDDTDPGSVGAGLEQEERLLQLEVTRQLEQRLTEAKASCLRCQLLLLPRGRTARVAQDVRAASADEPCGLRGAAIGVYVEFKDGLRAAGSVRPDPSVTPTFELSVVFRADEDAAWTPLLGVFDRHKVLRLRPDYRLVKRKLYSSASPVVHEFN